MASRHLGSKEDKNFLKLIFHLYNPSRLAIKFVFDKEFCPDMLNNEIKTRWVKLCELREKKLITASQLTSLKSPNLQSADLDITLMICLLTNLADLTVDERLPYVNIIDCSNETAMSTIRFYRNKFMHFPTSSVSDVMFNETIDALTKAVVKLNPALGKDCDLIRNGSFDEHLGTAMHELCSVGNYESVHSLIQKGLPVNEVNEYGNTPLHLASKEGHTNIVELLLSHGATAVVNNGQITESRPLHFASNNGHTDIVRILLQHEADVHVGNIIKSRPIHLATHENRIDIVGILIENGAKVNDINKYGSAPLHLASFNNLTEMAELLIKNGADVNKAKLDKRTPLHVACRYGNSEIVSLLCKYKALVNLPDKCGRTPLSYAEENKFEQIISILKTIDHS